MLIAGAGIGLSHAAERLAQLMGWQVSFRGTLFVAGATSMPALVATLAALRIGAFDLAIGSLLGRELFDMLIIALDDLMFMDGPVLPRVAPMHAVTAVVAIVMTALVMIGLTCRPPKPGAGRALAVASNIRRCGDRCSALCRPMVVPWAKQRRT